MPTCELRATVSLRWWFWPTLPLATLAHCVGLWHVSDWMMDRVVKPGVGLGECKAVKS
jgi:hypothetical protein